MTWKSFMSVMKDSIKSTAMVYLILVGADVFGKFLALTQLPMNLAGYIESLNVSRYVIILIIILVYAIMGCFMDALPMITLTVPIFLPVIQSLQFDPIWFGVLCIVVMQLGLHHSSCGHLQLCDRGCDQGCVSGNCVPGRDRVCAGNADRCGIAGYFPGYRALPAVCPALIRRR